MSVVLAEVSSLVLPGFGLSSSVMRNTRFDAVFGALIDGGGMSFTHYVIDITQPIAQHPVATREYVPHGYLISLERRGFVLQGIRIPASLFPEENQWAVDFARR